MKIPPLAAGTGLGLVAAALLLAPAFASLDRLANARAHRATAAATLAAPDHGGDALVTPGLSTPNVEALIGRIRNQASQGGVLVEQAVSVPAAPGLIAVRLRASGSEKALIAFADGIERDPPLVRLASWRLVPVSGGGLRLEGQALGAAR